MSFYFGHQGNLQAVKTPTTGLERTQQAYRASGTLTNGGGWVRSSTGQHYTYAINWDFIRNEDYAKIRALYDYGELIHFLDPQAAVSNSLPPYIAQAGDAARGGYRMIGYADAVNISETGTLAPLVTTGPQRTVRYEAIAGAPRKQIWLPVPTGHTLHLRGLTSGTASVQLAGSANLLTDSRLEDQTMTLNGGTATDTHPTTGGPDGGSFFRREWITSNTTSPVQMNLSGSGTSGLRVAAGETLTASAYIRATQNLPQFRIDVQWYTVTGANIGVVNGFTVAPTPNWTRHSQSYVAPSGAVYVQVRLIWTGVYNVTGQTFDMAMAQAEIGDTATVWSDGVLPASTSATTEAPSISAAPNGSAQGVYLTIGAGDDIDIRWLQTKVLPSGQPAMWGAWMPGLGHSGCRLDDVPSYTLYSAPQAIDYGALGLTLRETGAWE